VAHGLLGSARRRQARFCSLLLGFLSAGCSDLVAWDAKERVDQNRFIEATRDATQKSTVTLALVFAFVAVVALIQLLVVSGRRLGGPGDRLSKAPEVQHPWVFLAVTVVSGALSMVWAAFRVAFNPFSASGASFSAKAPAIALAVVCGGIALTVGIRLRAVHSRSRDFLEHRDPWPFRVTVGLVAALTAVWLAASFS